MPVEIRESVIRVTQRQPEEQEKKPEAGPFSRLKEGVSANTPKSNDIDVIIDLCAERVMDILKEKMQR